MTKAQTVRELLSRDLGKRLIPSFTPCQCGDCFYSKGPLDGTVERLRSAGWQIDGETNLAVDVSRVYCNRIARARILKWVYGGGQRAITRWHRDADEV